MASSHPLPFPPIFSFGLSALNFMQKTAMRPLGQLSNYCFLPQGPLKINCLGLRRFSLRPGAEAMEK